MHAITLDYEKSLQFIKEGDILSYSSEIKRCHDMLHRGTGLGSEYLGWLDLPDQFDGDYHGTGPGFWHDKGFHGKQIRQKGSGSADLRDH